MGGVDLRLGLELALELCRAGGWGCAYRGPSSIKLCHDKGLCAPTTIVRAIDLPCILSRCAAVSLRSSLSACSSSATSRSRLLSSRSRTTREFSLAAASDAEALACSATDSAQFSRRSATSSKTCRGGKHSCLSAQAIYTHILYYTLCFDTLRRAFQFSFSRLSSFSSARRLVSHSCSARSLSAVAFATCHSTPVDRERGATHKMAWYRARAF